MDPEEEKKKRNEMKRQMAKEYHDKNRDKIAMQILGKAGALPESQETPMGDDDDQSSENSNAGEGESSPE